MSPHKYRVGQIVTLETPAVAAPHESRTYKIIQLLPAVWGGTRYRIKSVVEETDRIVSEDCLSDDSCSSQETWHRQAAQAAADAAATSGLPSAEAKAAPDAGHAVTDIHVRRDEHNRWSVAVGATRSAPGTYRFRAYAEAYARALAYSRNVEMIVHEHPGRTTRHARAALTYPALLD